MPPMFCGLREETPAEVKLNYLAVENFHFAFCRDNLARILQTFAVECLRRETGLAVQLLGRADIIRFSV